MTALNIAMTDIGNASKRYHLVGMLGWQDVRQRYRRSVLGPFWLTISMGVMIATIGIVFGQIFHTPLREFLPYLAAGMIFWNFITLVVTEGCVGFISAEGIIKQLPIPLFVHVLRVMWRNLLIFVHNFMIFPLLLLIVGKPITWMLLLAIPGIALLILNLTWVALLLSVLCARYRDLPQIATSSLQVFFYLTPIMWMPSLLTNRISLNLLNLNPVYHVLTVARAPLLGQQPSLMNWLVSIGLVFVGWSIALSIYGRYKRRVVYWL